MAPFFQSPSPFREKSLLIAGLARNCAKSLHAEIKNLREAFSEAAHIGWIIVESDSDDQTPAVLAQLTLEIPHFTLLSLGKVADKIPLRAPRIAYCRNQYLHYLDQNRDRYDFLVVADLDGINDGLSARAVNSCGTRNDWDVCTANQNGPYYDIWALRHEDWSPNDCWRQFNFYRAHGYAHERALQSAVYSRMVRIDSNEAWIPVESAFGGLGIYNVDILKDARYAGLSADGQEICEHVALHEYLRAKGARIFINPNLTNGGFNEHTEALKLWPTLKRRTKHRINRWLGKI